MKADRCLLLALSRLAFGGAERLLAHVTAYLKQSGVRVIIAKFGAADPSYSLDVPWFADTAEVVCNLTEHAPRARWADLVIDLMQSHSVTSVAISDSDDAYRMLPVLRAALPSLWISDLHYNPLAQLDNNRRYGGFIDTTIAQSIRTANALVAAGASPDRVTVIPGGIEVGVFVPAPPDQEARRRLGLGDKLVAGYFARFDDTKNPLGFFEVVRLSGGESWGYAVGGGGPLDQDVKAAAARLPAGINLKLFGIVDNAAEFYRLIDVLVATSRNEGRPLAIMESCAMAKPVIATSVGGVPEIVSDGVNGFLCRKDDMGAIAERLSWFASHPHELASMGQRARDIAVSEFDIAASLPRYLAALLGPR
jgi:O-antigen biosynthesis protein